MHSFTMCCSSMIPMLVASIKLVLSITLFLPPITHEHTPLEENLQLELLPNTNVQLPLAVPTSYSVQSADKEMLRSRRLLQNPITGDSVGKMAAERNVTDSFSSKCIRRRIISDAHKRHSHNRSTSRPPKHSSSSSPDPFHLDYSGPRIHPPRNN